VGGFTLLLDVEVRDEEEANEAIAAGADVVMLDNIEGSELASVARRLRERWTGEGKKFLLETSGGITENNLCERAIARKSNPDMPQLTRITLSFYAIRDRYPEYELRAPVGTTHRL
jgi:nicotinate-nucleotide pyrophosphorylase